MTEFIQHTHMNIARSLTNLPGLDLEWQMTNCERFALASLLERLEPDLSLEIGTYRGGSLQVLSRYSKKVISLDIDPTVETRLAKFFNNVEFRAGDSRALLPSVVSEINSTDALLGFVLIDGDHSAEGVQRNIEAVLKIQPKRRIVIILHHSFNADCRQGMRNARWADCPFVHYVELEFIPGIYHFLAYDTAEARTMWGGFACAVIEPNPRSEPLKIPESQKHLFETVFPESSHHPSKSSRKHSRLRRLVSKLRSLGR